MSGNICDLASVTEVRRYLFPHEVSKMESEMMCKQMGGYLPMPADKADVDMMMGDVADSGSLGCFRWPEYQWLPIERRPLDGVWMHSETR